MATKSRDSGSGSRSGLGWGRTALLQGPNKRPNMGEQAAVGPQHPQPWTGEGAPPLGVTGGPTPSWVAEYGKPDQYDLSGNQMYPDWMGFEPWRGLRPGQKGAYYLTGAQGQKVGELGLLESGEWDWNLYEAPLEFSQNALWGGPDKRPTLVAGDSGYGYTEVTERRGNLVLGAITDAAARTGLSPEAFLGSAFGVDAYGPGGIPGMLEQYLQKNKIAFGGYDEALASLIMQIRDKAAGMAPAPAPSPGLAEETAPTPDLSTNFWSDMDLSAFASTPTFEEDLGDAVSVAYNDIIGRAFGR